jgi:hypothetical protein
MIELAESLASEIRARHKDSPEKITKIHALLDDIIPQIDANIHFFSKNHDFHLAISLIVLLDMSWQVLRKNRNGEQKDDEWIKNFVPNSPPEFEEYVHKILYREDRAIFENAKFVYELHTAIRHPNDELAQLLEKYPGLFHDPWPAERSRKLLQAAENMREIFQIILENLDDPSPWGSPQQST